jgi:hypothetical protein
MKDFKKEIISKLIAEYNEGYNKGFVTQDYDVPYEIKNEMKQEFLGMDTDELQTQLESDQSKLESKIFELIKEHKANEMMLHEIKRANEIKDTNKRALEVEQTKFGMNKWIRDLETVFYDTEKQVEKIENMIYRFDINLQKSWRSYYRVFYSFYLVNRMNGDVKLTITTQDKEFESIEEATKYFGGRKKAFSKYFKEVNPTITLDIAEMHEKYKNRTEKRYQYMKTKLNGAISNIKGFYRVNGEYIQNIKFDF